VLLLGGGLGVIVGGLHAIEQKPKPVQ
jgi:hypothetical protein